MRQTWAALRLLVLLSLLLGLAYPLAVLGVARVAFPHQAAGSLVRADGRVVGSSLIGQEFADPQGRPLPQYLQPRPSAAGAGYDATASAASNRGPDDVTDEAGRTSLLTTVRQRAAELGPGAPPDALTASGSGLDPDISPAYARLQVARIAAARGLPVAAVRAVVDAHVQGRTLGVLGEPRVDVLETNIALDALR